ncbi:alpha/beta hydrolase family protein [Nocardia thailandica]|uniref:Alpha/beta hydrolase family protein n=1 Tax=Nocardia thailandica TaxID=257275 RepID=A0ABW6PQ46_9NOCA
MPSLPSFGPRPHTVFSTGFYPDPDFDYEVRLLLGATAYHCADAGEVLATVASVDDKDHERWFTAWLDTADRARALADTAAAAGHRVSAAQAYLRAATYYAVAVNSVSGLASDDRLLPTFRAHRAAWDRFAEAGPHDVDRIAIPYEDRTLPGYFFRAAGERRARPTLVMVNGSDGALSGLWSSGAAGALARGYHVLLFDGPGQQSMLFEHGVGFRPDWEAVLTPVADALLERAEVDTDRLAVYGVSQGGFWVARALAFEHRFAAAVTDPGVTDVAASWVGHLPKSLLEKFEAGKKKSFDRAMGLGMKFSRTTSRTWNFRARPYRRKSYFDTLTEVHRYRLDPQDARRITTPVFITDPEHEQFWPGQSKHLAELIGDRAALCRFTAAEGADFHCQPMARQLTDQRMFDWLDTTLHRSGS